MRPWRGEGCRSPRPSPARPGPRHGAAGHGLASLGPLSGGAAAPGQDKIQPRL